MTAIVTLAATDPKKHVMDRSNDDFKERVGALLSKQLTDWVRLCMLQGGG